MRSVQKKTRELVATLAVVMAVTIPGCKEGGHSAEVGAIQKLADEACACKDVSCANAANARWADLEKTRQSGAKLSEADAKAFKEHALRFATCVTNITNAADATAPANP